MHFTEGDEVSPPSISHRRFECFGVDVEVPDLIVIDGVM
jgi:hypothetical protein